MDEENGRNQVAVVKKKEKNIQEQLISFLVSYKIQRFQLKKSWYLENRDMHLQYSKRKHVLKLKSMKKRHARQLKIAHRKKEELKLKQMEEKHYMILNHKHYLKHEDKVHEMWLEYAERKTEILTELSKIATIVEGKK